MVDSSGYWAFWRNKNVLTASYRLKRFHTWRFISCDGLSEARRWRVLEEDWMWSLQASIKAETMLLKLGAYFWFSHSSFNDLWQIIFSPWGGRQWTWMTVWRCLQCSLNDAGAQKALIAFSLWCSPASPFLSSAVLICNPVGAAATIGHSGLIATLRRYSGTHKCHLQTWHESHTAWPVWRQTFQRSISMLAVVSNYKWLF